ncbi:MAG: hypothetical protein EKK52_02910 [Burkholderiales bacterium]|uniref:hypothetical protein n=1 Tax=Roseateles sp. TaxID=1971397 RepID=UPI000FC259B7|nr:MAG: hypothetical protein EKK52_02910 [Burkholderiales bacterium]
MGRRWLKRRWLVVGLLGLVVVLGWQGLRPASSPGEAARGLAPGAAAASSQNGAPTGPAASAVASAAAGGSVVDTPSSRSEIVIAGERIPPEGFEICGMGRVSADEIRRASENPGSVASWQGELAQLTLRGDAALARMAARLAAGSDRQQVAARLMMGDVNGAALLASPSADPVAYQLALTACAPGRTLAEWPGCRGLSVQRWAELDPADARPWIGMLGVALQRGGEAAIDAALAGVAARTKLSRGFWLLESELAAVIETEPDIAARGQALVKVIGVDAATVNVDILNLMRACDSKLAAHAKRLPPCRAAARQLLAASSNLMEASLAQRLADQMGVPKSAQAFDAPTLKAAREAYSESGSALMGFDCPSLVKWTGFSRERAEKGELALALSLLSQRQGH